MATYEFVVATYEFAARARREVAHTSATSSYIVRFSIAKEKRVKQINFNVSVLRREASVNLIRFTFAVLPQTEGRHLRSSFVLCVVYG